MRPSAPRASGSRIAVNAAVAIVLIVMGTRTTGPSAAISYVLGGIMALSALALGVIALRNRRTST
jgi:LPXTG-motif cell wall-anchored protein